MAKILIIDDEKSIRNTLKEILEYEGYLVDEAADGQTGLEKLENDEYEAVFPENPVFRAVVDEIGQIEGLISGRLGKAEQRVRPRNQFHHVPAMRSRVTYDQRKGLWCAAAQLPAQVGRIDADGEGHHRTGNPGKGPGFRR